MITNLLADVNIDVWLRSLGASAPARQIDESPTCVTSRKVRYVTKVSRSLWLSGGV